MSAKKAEQGRSKKVKAGTANHHQPRKRDAIGRIVSVVPQDPVSSLAVAYDPTHGSVGELFRRQIGKVSSGSVSTLGE